MTMENRASNDMPKDQEAALHAVMEKRVQEITPMDDLESGKETYEAMLETLRTELASARHQIDELEANPRSDKVAVAQIRSSLETMKRLARAQLMNTYVEVGKLRDQLDMIKQQIKEQN